jgi:hypothetical protein
MPSCVLATTKAGSVRQPIYIGTTAPASIQGDSRLTRPASNSDTAAETARVIQRLPARKPRNSACSPRVRYSGMIFCAEAEMPKSIMLPSSSTQVQT